MSGRPITLMCEQPPTCGECGRRLNVSDQPVDHDQDGPIYAGNCPDHGIWLLQDDPGHDEEEDEGEDT